jgi:hypothetical protein
LKGKGSKFFEANFENIRNITAKINLNFSTIFDYWKSIKSNSELLEIFFIETFPKEQIQNVHNLHEFRTFYQALTKEYQGDDLKAFLREKIAEILKDEIQNENDLNMLQKNIPELFKDDNKFLTDYTESIPLQFKKKAQRNFSRNFKALNSQTMNSTSSLNQADKISNESAPNLNSNQTESTTEINLTNTTVLNLNVTEKPQELYLNSSTLTQTSSIENTGPRS